MSIQFVTNYRENDQLRNSFMELAKDVFGIDFTTWYEMGYWSEQYIPYSFVENNQVIANASVTNMTVCLAGETYKTAQIGTVMTNEAYRNKGLSKKLIEHIIREVEPYTDFIFLFANETVLDFYPKFGFKRYPETSFVIESEGRLDYSHTRMNFQSVKMNVPKERRIIESIIENSRKSEGNLTFIHHESLRYFYLTTVFPKCIFYAEEFQCIAMMEQEGTTLNVYDLIISEQSAYTEKEIIASLWAETIENIQLLFTPDFSCEGLITHNQYNDEDALFIRGGKELPFADNLFPLTAHA